MPHNEIWLPTYPRKEAGPRQRTGARAEVCPERQAAAAGAAALVSYEKCEYARAPHCAQTRYA
jgi:hypothetical protein